MGITVTLTDIENLTNQTSAENALNNNSATIMSGFSTAYNLTGDTLQGEMDANSNRIINLPAPASGTEPLRLQDISSLSISTSSAIPGTTTAGLFLQSTTTEFTTVWAAVSSSGGGGSGSAQNFSASALTGTTLASNVVVSSLTTVGTISSGTWQGTALATAYVPVISLSVTTNGGVTGTLPASSMAVVNLATSAHGGVTGNLPVTNLNGGTGSSATTFWRGDGTWSVIPGSSGNQGTVTNVAMTVPSGLSVAGSPVTASGTFALTWATGSIPVVAFNSGSGATTSTFWRGDGSWATPAGGGSGGNAYLGVVVQDTSESGAALSGISSNKMAGFTFSTITPVYSDRILAIINTTFLPGNSSGITLLYSINYGTGAPPTNGAASTGISIISAQINTANGFPVPIVAIAAITGLNPSTSYWVDLCCTLGGFGSQTGSLGTPILTAFEI